MSEVIAKSKGYKAERQHQKDLDEDLRDELDEGLDDLRALLQEGPSDSSTYRPKAISHDNDAEYSQFVKTLAFEARAKPKDRTKTEDELAMEEKERLEEAEAKRLRRMRGEESDNEESGAKRRKVDSRREGDDLGDDFIDEDEEDLLGPGLTREVIEQGSGYSRTAKPERVAGGAEDDPADEETDEHEEEDGTDGGSRSDQDDEDDDDSAEGDSIDDDLDSAELDDLDDGYGGNSDEEEAEDLVRRSKPKATSRTAEIPYTFDCPESIDQFEDIMTSLEDSALPTVVHRIRAIHHPSLAQGNKERLQVRLVFVFVAWTDHSGFLRSPTGLCLTTGVSRRSCLRLHHCPDSSPCRFGQTQSRHCGNSLHRENNSDAKESGSRSRQGPVKPAF